MNARLSGAGAGLRPGPHLPAKRSCRKASPSSPRISARRAAEPDLRALAPLLSLPRRCLSRQPVNAGCLMRHTDRGEELSANAVAFFLLCLRIAIAAIGGKRACGLCCSTTSSSLPLVAEPRETGQLPAGQATATRFHRTWRVRREGTCPVPPHSMPTCRCGISRRLPRMPTPGPRCTTRAGLVHAGPAGDLHCRGVQCRSRAVAGSAGRSQPPVYVLAEQHEAVVGGEVPEVGGVEPHQWDLVAQAARGDPRVVPRPGPAAETGRPRPLRLARRCGSPSNPQELPQPPLNLALLVFTSRRRPGRARARARDRRSCRSP